MLAHTPAEAEAVAIGGNGFRAVGTIAALEARLERPVVTANQALLWAALAAAGADTSTVSGYGTIFERSPLSTSTTKAQCLELMAAIPRGSG